MARDPPTQTKTPLHSRGGPWPSHTVGPVGPAAGGGRRRPADRCRRSRRLPALTHRHRELGQPDAVYLKYPPTLKQVTLVYAQRADIPVSGLTGVSVLVSEARGSINEQFFGKILGPDTTLEEVSVGGRAGYWISGHPHNFVFTDADGQPFFDEMRLATNTLIYDRGDGTIVRIEADTTKERAIQIALSM